MNSINNLSASNRNLRRLFWMRNVMIVCLVLAAIALQAVSVPLPVLPISIAVAGTALLNVYTWSRLRRQTFVREAEMFVQLLGDVIALTVLFYFSGGYTNPFVWMYLLPITVAAVALSWRYAWGMAGLGIVCYTGLMFYYVPLSHLHMHHQINNDFDIHLFGMWMGFVICALIIVVFVTRIGQNLRDYDRMMAAAREKTLESERVLALGTLATAAAHELGTPLATMAVIAGELARDHAADPNLQAPLEMLRSQIKRCKEILTSITASAGEARAEDSAGQPLDVFITQILTRWQDTRPATPLTIQIDFKHPTPNIVADRTIGQALQNLLDNAAEASPTHIEISGHGNQQDLLLNIRDFGLGVAPEIANSLGTPFVTTKPDSGMGLGLYLAQLVFERLGGSVSLSNHAQGGAVSQVRLPLKGLLVRGLHDNNR